KGWRGTPGQLGQERGALINVQGGQQPPGSAPAGGGQPVGVVGLLLSLRKIHTILTGGACSQLPTRAGYFLSVATRRVGLSNSARADWMSGTTISAASKVSTATPSVDRTHMP